MSRRLVPLLLVALCAAGCVPVTEPVHDIDKAEPDKALVGSWTTTDSNGTSKVVGVKAITVDVPAVKGNPKGLMRAKTELNGSEGDFWFFLSTVGKETYANLALVPGSAAPDFSKEGAFAKWRDGDRREFFIIRLTREGDELTLDSGNLDVFLKLMSDAKIPGNETKPLEPYATPAGWLDKYLAKTGPAKVFDKTNYLELKREKK